MGLHNVRLQRACRSLPNAHGSKAWYPGRHEVLGLSTGKQMVGGASKQASYSVDWAARYSGQVWPF